MKYRIIATNNRTNWKGYYCGMAGRFWFALLPSAAVCEFDSSRINYYRDQLATFESISIATQHGDRYLRLFPASRFTFSLEEVS